MKRWNLVVGKSAKVLSVLLSVSMVCSMTAACGKKSEGAEPSAVIERLTGAAEDGEAEDGETEGTESKDGENEGSESETGESADTASTDATVALLENAMYGEDSMKHHSAESGKSETVYVLSDADGAPHEVIVSDWLRNKDGAAQLKDESGLKDIKNVSGYETFEQSGDSLVWQADGSDIHYQGTTDRPLPVDVKVSYKLDGKPISPEELAGKSGRVTIRFDYENKEKRTITVDGAQEQVSVPFAMMSGMILPEDTFTNIEVKNGKVISEGKNSIVIGMAVPGLRESLNIEDLKSHIDDEDMKKSIDEIEIPDYVEVAADTENFAPFI